MYAINKEVKGNLARLLAAENLMVEHKKVSTASFNVVDRILTLPLWERASSTVYDMLVGHEVGHALFTPVEDWRDSLKEEIPKDYVNVVEDARIEKLMKRKYAGLARSFYYGYKELNHNDFFGLKDEDISKMSLIDRINLQFKIGNYINIPFEKNEYHFIPMIENVESFEEVIDVCKKIVLFLKENQTPDTIQEHVSNMDLDELGNSSNSSLQESSQRESDNQVEGNSDKSSEKEDEANSDSSGGANSSGRSISDGEESKTQKNFEDKISDLNDPFGSNPDYASIPEFDVNKRIVSYKKIIELFETDHNVFPRDKVISSLNDYRNFVSKEVNYLVKEFEMKKSADAYHRGTISRTGVIDTNKLHTYKYNDNIFKKISVIPEGKNHGMIFLLDWSGSMYHHMRNTVKQLIKLLWFCKKVQIPFEVYAFSDQYYCTEVIESLEDRTSFKPNTIFISPKFSLLNFVSSKSTNSEFKSSIENLWFLGNVLDSYRSIYGHVPMGLDLGGTPLNESLMCLHKIIPQFKRQNSLSKVNVITLTDGVSNWMTYNSDEYSQVYQGEFLRKRIRNNFCLRDRKTGRVYRGVNENESNSSFTTILIEDLKFKFPEVNFIGFRVMNMYEFSNFLRYVNPNHTYFGNHSDTWADYKKQFKKDNCFSFKENVGYDTLFTILTNMMKEEKEVDLDKTSCESVNIRNVASQFRKKMKSKTTNKKMLSQFTELVS